jgi:hypothetical protein
VERAQRVVKNDFGCGPLSSFFSFSLFQLYGKQSKKKRKKTSPFSLLCVVLLLRQQQQQQPIMFL